MGVRTPAHHIFALGIGQELAEQAVLAGGRVSGKGNAGTAVIPHISEGHHLYVYSGAPGIGNIIVTAVYVGSGVIQERNTALMASIS